MSEDGEETAETDGEEQLARPSESEGSATGWPWLLGAALIAMLSVVAYLVTQGGDSSWGEPGDDLDGTASPLGLRGQATIGAPEGHSPTAPTENGQTFVYDPVSLLNALYDGGVGAALSHLLDSGVHGEYRAAHRSRDGLLRRIGELRREAEDARERGLEGQEQRLTRDIEALGAQLMTVTEHLHELEAQLPDAGMDAGSESAP